MTCNQALLLFFVFTSATLLAPFTSGEESKRVYGPWVWGVSAGAVHQSDADFSDGPGEFNVSRGFVQGSLGYAWDRRTSISLSLGAGASNFDFSPEATIDGKEPWELIQDYRLSAPIRFSPTERSDVILIPSVRTYAESGASFSDGRTEGILGGISWRLSASLTIGPGMGWFSEVGGGSNAFPILIIDWKITDKISLTTGRGLTASQGPGLSLNYQLDRKWKLGLTGRYEKTRFALDTDESGSAEIGEERTLPLLLVLDYSPWPMTSLSVIAGAEFDGSLRLEDTSGRRIAGTDFRTAPVIGLSFTSRF